MTPEEKEPERVAIEGGGVWWPKPGYLWAANGQAFLPRALSKESATEMVERYNTGEYWCCSCKQWFQKPPAFDRFAGRYCGPCAEEYKRLNTRKCLLCGRPIWDCYC